jgi:uncharacterized damage-inducible protein DinB
MKQLFLLPLVAIMAFASPTALTKKERKFARENLKDTKKELVKTVKGLSEAQLKFKPAENRWSVEECVKHIAAAELLLWQTVENGLKQPANPEKRSEIKMSDEQLLKGIKDRSSKFQAPEPIQPKNTTFQSTEEALSAFRTNRDKLIEYMKNTQEDMRNHVINFPVGMMDAYQLVLLVSAHSSRHTDQIKEVMADPNFPKQ